MLGLIRAIERVGREGGGQGILVFQAAGDGVSRGGFLLGNNARRRKGFFAFEQCRKCF